MKKFLIGISLFLILVGCAVEESPEYYFDTALTEIESLNQYETHVKVTLNENQVLLEYDAINKDMQTENASTLLNWTVGTPMESMEDIATFNYANIFTDFSYEEGVVYCSIPVEKNNPIVKMVNVWSDEEIATIDHIMYLDGQSLSSVEIIVQTNTQTFVYNITLSD